MECESDKGVILLSPPPFKTGLVPYSTADFSNLLASTGCRQFAD